MEIESEVVKTLYPPILRYSQGCVWKIGPRRYETVSGYTARPRGQINLIGEHMIGKNKECWVLASSEVVIGENNVAGSSPPVLEATGEKELLDRHLYFRG